jgi:KDO2-lipid IV(A) lauroyltransferase
MSKIKYLVIAGLLKMVGMLSLANAQRIGKWIGLLIWKLPTQARQVTDTNLSICLPALSESDRAAMSKASMIQTGQTMLEVPLMWEWPVVKSLDLVKETEGLELIDQAMSAGKGLILLAPHLGNWELVGLFFSSRYNGAALYSPPKIPEFEDYMIKVRGRLGAELVRGDRRGLIRIVSLLREGRIVGVLPDQTPRGTSNAFAPFFGMSVNTMTLVAKLMQRTGASALITYAERLPDASGFRIVVRQAEAGLDDKDAVVAATALNRSVERCVLEVPDQYQWEYKRMRHRPPGEINPYNPDRVC